MNLLMTIAFLLCGTLIRASESPKSPTAAGPTKPDYWVRKPLTNPHCGKARPVMTAWMGTPDVRKLEDKVRQALDDANAKNISQACSGGYSTPGDQKQGAPHVVINVWVDESAAESIKSKISNLSKSAAWNTNAYLAGVDASVVERWNALRGELAEHEALLSCSPHTLDLVKAEIARLEPFAKAYLDTKDKTHVQIIIYTPK